MDDGKRPDSDQGEGVIVRHSRPKTARSESAPYAETRDGSAGGRRSKSTKSGGSKGVRNMVPPKDADDQYSVDAEMQLDLLEAYDSSQRKIEELLLVIKENETKLELYKNVSQQFSDAYEELKLKYEAENDAANTVMVKASQWYKENEKLKRKSTFLLNKLQACNLEEEMAAEESEDGVSEVYSSDENVASFMADMKARLGEVTREKDQALKSVEKLQRRIEAEKKRYAEEAFQHRLTLEELECQRAMLNRLKKVSVMAVSEFDLMRGRLAEKEAIAIRAVNEKQEVDRERKALKRTSTMLMSKLAPDQQLQNALMKVEEMTVTLEAVKSRLEEKKTREEEQNKNLERLQDQLKWSTHECMEAELKEKKNVDKIQNLEKTVRDLTRRLESPSKAPPPPPPPPPPMPAQQWSWNPLGLLMNAIGLSRSEPKKQLNIAAPKDNLQKKAMDDMMQKIERGEFRLRPIKIDTSVDDDNEEENNPAIDEFRSVVGTLKKGGSLRSYKQPRPISRQQNFTYSLKPKERPPIPSFVEKGPTPELESKLVKRRKAISTVIEEPEIQTETPPKVWE